MLFKTKDDAYKAANLHMEKLGKRFIEVLPSTLKEFELFITQNYPNSMPVYSKDRMPHISAEKKKNTLLLVGLPFNVTKAQIQSFLQDYEVPEREIHILLTHSGKQSGNVLVTFEDEMQAQRALKQKNYQYLGERYIECFEFSN